MSAQQWSPEGRGRCGEPGLAVPARSCELPAGHPGWHREGHTEWSRGTTEADSDAYRDRLAAELADLRRMLRRWAAQVRALPALPVSSAKIWAEQTADDMVAAASSGSEGDDHAHE